MNFSCRKGWMWMTRITQFSILVIGCLANFFCLQRYFKKMKYGQLIKEILFAVYLYGFLYFTFFSREAGSEAIMTLQLFKSYRFAITFDFGFSHVIKQIFTEGLSAGLASIHIVAKKTFEGIILNILLFIPLGYMLPCIFRKLGKALWKVILIGFLCSLITETVQLVTHLGWFDLDDLFNNTIGCAVGAVLYVMFLRERKRESEGEVGI